MTSFVSLHKHQCRFRYHTTHPRCKFSTNHIGYYIFLQTKRTYCTNCTVSSRFINSGKSQILHNKIADNIVICLPRQWNIWIQALSMPSYGIFIKIQLPAIDSGYLPYSIYRSYIPNNSSMNCRQIYLL